MVEDFGVTLLQKRTFYVHAVLVMTSNHVVISCVQGQLLAENAGSLATIDIGSMKILIFIALVLLVALWPHLLEVPLSWLNAKLKSCWVHCGVILCGCADASTRHLLPTIPH